MIFAKAKNKELDKFAELLSTGVVGLFMERGEIQFSKAPVLEKKSVLEYEGRMRVDGMDKFSNEATYISAINYYASKADMEKHSALGVIVVYVKQTYLANLMKSLKYPPIDDDNDDELRDSCGTLCNLIAGRFKSEMVKAGYVELEMSSFTNFRNSSFGGVEFSSGEFDKYEISFFIANEKRLAIEMSMGPVPKG